MILVTLRGAAAGWSPDTAELHSAELSSGAGYWIIHPAHSHRSQLTIIVELLCKQLPIFAHLQYATFSHIQKSKVGQRGHFVTKKCATNDVVRRHLAIFHVKGQK